MIDGSWGERIPGLVPMSLGGPTILVDPLETNATRREAEGAKRNLLPRGMEWECRHKALRMVDKSTGESVDFDCKSWTCLVHGPRVAWRWKQRLGAVPWQYMLTLTLVPDRPRDARVAWYRLARWLRSSGHMTTFVRVLEFGGNTGMKHWHVLVRGRSWAKQDLARLRDESRAAGLGNRVHVARVGDRVGAVAYLLKYALKDVGVRDARRSGFRNITCSRDVPSWKRVLERLGKGREEGREFAIFKGGAELVPVRAIPAALRPPKRGGLGDKGTSEETENRSRIAAVDAGADREGSESP